MGFKVIKMAWETGSSKLVYLLSLKDALLANEIFLEDDFADYIVCNLFRHNGEKSLVVKQEFGELCEYVIEHYDLFTGDQLKDILICKFCK